MKRVGYGLLIGAVVITLGYRFQNPYLTETQLFLALWPVVLAAVCGVVLVIARSRP